MKKRIKIQGLLIFLAIALSILFAKFLFRRPQDSLLARFLDGLGAGLLLLGFLLRIAGRGYKKETSAQSEKLVIAGPYQLVRNPMYLGTLFIGLGITLSLFAWWMSLVFLAVYLAIYIPQVRREEKILSQRFAQDYWDYCKRVPRFFPGIADCFSVDLRRRLSFKKAWLKTETVSLIATFIFILAFKIWKESGAVRFFLVASVLAGIIFALFHEKKDIPAKS
jgi:protein-S-isoprenylcysteine O-methyltransferase Ste14